MVFSQDYSTSQYLKAYLLYFRVIFKFKSSKKSNNGTDVNAGQIPQLLYRFVLSIPTAVKGKCKYNISCTCIAVSQYKSMMLYGT